MKYNVLINQSYNRTHFSFESAEKAVEFSQMALANAEETTEVTIKFLNDEEVTDEQE